MRIAQYSENSSEFDNFIFQNASCCLYSPLNIKYSFAYESNAHFLNLSFGVVFKGSFLCCLILYLKEADGRQTIDGGGRPALYTQKKDLTEKERKTIRTLVRDHLSELIKQYPNSGFHYYETFGDNYELSMPGLFLLENGATPKHFLSNYIDLSLSNETLAANIRKSYKSLINWGKNNLTLRLLDCHNIVEQDIENFRQLHISVAGRETRQKLTWDLMYEMVVANEAFMIDGTLDDQLVTASFFMYNKNHCYYGVSASIRELFDKPLLHASIWMAIEYAKQKQIHWLETGNQYFESSSNVSKKEIDISLFKRGFGGAIYPKIIIEK